MQCSRSVLIILMFALVFLGLTGAVEAGGFGDSKAYRAESPAGRAMPASDDEGSDDESDDGPTPCEKTARVAKQACRKDVADDYLTQIGNCLNLSDPEDAAECREDARDMWVEELAACGERMQARLDFCDLLDEERYDPEIDPQDFVSPAEIADDPNRFFPLVPGNTWVYENEEEIIRVTVTDETIEILGVTCVVVRDVVTLKADGERGGDGEEGEVIEDTVDWYAQDLEGNLWYFGEIAQNFENGLLTDLDGSWTAGVDYAKPGILIPEDPYPGMAYRQEFLLREAEDGAEVVSTNADVPTRSDEFDCDENCLQTLEFTPVEPDVAEYKFYLPGVGLILELDPESGDRTELVSFTNEAP